MKTGKKRGEIVTPRRLRRKKKFCKRTLGNSLGLLQLMCEHKFNLWLQFKVHYPFASLLLLLEKGHLDGGQ